MKNIRGQKVKRSMIYCEPCGFKKIIDHQQEQTIGLTEVPRCPIQKGIPQEPGSGPTNVTKAPLTDIKRCEELREKAKAENSIYWCDETYMYSMPGLAKNQMFKCPKCGRGVILRGLLPAYTRMYEALDQQKERERLEQDKLKRIEDGKPAEKPVLPEGPQFLG